MNLFTAIVSSIMVVLSFFNGDGSWSAMGWIFAACGYFTLWNVIKHKTINKNENNR